MFLIPSLISDEVPTKLVPAICKLIERNILLNYSSVFRDAAVLKYLGPDKGLLQDACQIIDRVKELTSLLEADEDSSTEKPRRPTGSSNYGGSSKEGDKWSGKPETKSKDQIEIPRGISFYDTISLEPTYLEIPLQGRTRAGSADEITKIIKIGMKCIPYKLDNTTDILQLMDAAKTRSYVKTLYMKKIARLKKFFGGAPRDPKDRITQILNTISTANELANPRYVAKLMGSGFAVNWSFLTVFTSYDFSDKKLRDLLLTYRDMVNGGFGDIVVVDDTKNVISFCTQRLLSCNQLDLDYLKEVLKLDNIIDADLFKKSSASSPMFPGRILPVSKIFESTCIPCSKNKEHINEMMRDYLFKE